MFPFLLLIYCPYIALQGKLFYADGDCSTLPGQPRIELDTLDFDGYLEKEHLVPDLDRLAPKLWLVRSSRFRFGSSLGLSTVRYRPRVVDTSRPYTIKQYEDVGLL